MADFSLHKNTGRMSWRWHIDRFFFDLTVAEDPRHPLWRRTWSRHIEGGLRDSLFEIARFTVDWGDGSTVTMWSVVMGPLKINWLLTPK